MPVTLGHDALYLPKVGKPSLTDGVSYGYLALTHQSLVYVPQLLHKITGAFRNLKETSLDVEKYAGLDFWDVVPAAAAEARDLDVFDGFLREMASKIDGSRVTALSDVQRYRVGFFAGFTVVTGSDRTRYVPNGKARREISSWLRLKGLTDS